MCYGSLAASWLQLHYGFHITMHRFPRAEDSVSSVPCPVPNAPAPILEAAADTRHTQAFLCEDGLEMDRHSSRPRIPASGDGSAVVLAGRQAHALLKPAPPSRKRGHAFWRGATHSPHAARASVVILLTRPSLPSSFFSSGPRLLRHSPHAARASFASSLARSAASTAARTPPLIRSSETSPAPCRPERPRTFVGGGGGGETGW